MTDEEIVAKAVANIKERHKERDRREALHARVERLAKEVCKQVDAHYDSAEKEIRRLIHDSTLPRPSNGEIIG